MAHFDAASPTATIFAKAQALSLAQSFFIFVLTPIDYLFDAFA